MVARDSILRSELQWRQIVASLGLNLDEQKAVDRFRKAIVEPSMTKLVILDFWAEWCGPCKALTPVLEKVAADYADKGVILAKVNVDEEQFIAAQFQVRSIPTVYAMFQGQPVADLTQARSESQLKQYLDQILSQLPVEPGAPGEEAPQDVAPLIAMGEEILGQGDGERAATIFAQIIEIAPDNAHAHAGLIRALLAAGHKDEAQAVLDGLDPKLAQDPALAQARAALALAEEAPRKANWRAFAPQPLPRPTTWRPSWPSPTACSPPVTVMPPPTSCWRWLPPTAHGTKARRAPACSRSSRRSVWKIRGWRAPAASCRPCCSADAHERGGRQDQAFDLPAVRGAAVPRPATSAAHFRAALSGDGVRCAGPRPAHRDDPAAGPCRGAPLFAVGCLGKIEDVEALEDGGFNILLAGVARFRVLRELDVSTPFRQIEAQLLPDDPDEVLSAVERAGFEREARTFADAQGYSVDWDSVARLDDQSLINGVSQIAPFDFAAKQALLEAPGLAARCELLIQLMQFFGRRDADDDEVTLQ
jgi:putative thioredoxin